MMKCRKIINIIAVVGITIVTTVGFTACNKNSDYGEDSYKIGNSYRVLQLDEDKTQFIENYGLEGVVPINNIGLEYEYTCDHYFPKNSLFFHFGDDVSREAVKVIYNCLGIEQYTKLSDGDVYFCSSSYLGTYSNAKTAATLTATTKYENGMMPGYVADSYKYTFNYTDYSESSGEIIGTGVISVLVTAEVSTVGVYEYDNFTSIYKV